MIDVDAELLDAFWAYERALGDNDVPVLESSFAAGDSTLRADGDGVLVGHETISEFRRRRPLPRRRVVERLHLRPLADGVVLAVAETARADGRHGTQTQVWTRGEHGWQVTAAHVAVNPPRPAPVDVDPLEPTIWRVVGDTPLRPATAPGPLTGVRVAVKDLFAVQGQRIGAGNRDWLAAASPEPADAPALSTLLDAGADVVGIAHTDELAFSLAGSNPHYGTPPNVAAPGRITGGSSSGPAAAVTAGLADLGLGTDTAGSIRVPASYCGLYGLRPTHGAVAIERVHALAPSFDTVGLLARDATVLDAAARVLLPTTPIPRIDELVVADDVLALVEPPMRLAFAAAVLALSGHTGRPITRIPSVYGEALEAWFTAFRTVQAAQAWRLHGPFVQAHRGRMDPAVEARFVGGAGVDDAAYAAAEALLEDARDRLRAVLPPGTALALPAASSAAPPVDMDPGQVETIRAATLRLTCLASLSGRPALVLPRAQVEGLPAGLCLIGDVGADLALLDLLR